MQSTDLLDAYDKRILKALEKDGKKPFSTIATELGISNTMVHQRVMRMKELKVLLGTTVVIDQRKLGFDWGTFTGLVLKEDADSNEVIAALKRIPEVIECYYITGSYTLYIRVVAKTNQHMRELLYEKIDHIKGVQKTESIIDFGCAFKRNVPFGE
ncbi:MAG: Lrp/AsnC ligand binding domain-containing protein [Bacteroidota bacterium]